MCDALMIISKKISVLSLVALLLILGLPAFLIVNIQGKTSATTGFTAPKIPANSTFEISNGQIETFWSLVDTYQNIPEISDQTSNNYVKFANNGTHLFTLITALKTLKWISIEFEPNPSECMANLNDGWTFYVDAGKSVVDPVDVNFIGTIIPFNDNKNDLSIESVFSEDLVQIEVVRPFNTQDTDGYDIIYSNGSINTLQFATNTDHFGSHEIYYLFITDVVIGDNSDNEETDEIIGPNPDDLSQVNLDQVDLSQIKFALMGVTPIGIIGFLIVHFLRRVYRSPIEHNFTRISRSSKNPPTFLERWKETFSSKER
jgi:hypothetical protein